MPIPDGMDVWIRIDVTDTGIGMRKQDIVHLFQPFRQVQADFTLIDLQFLAYTYTLYRLINLPQNNTVAPVVSSYAAQTHLTVYRANPNI
jgi:hypothetical protein